MLGGEKVIVDSRPSDAIALALRTDSPIFVAEHVMRSSRGVISRRDVEEEEGSEDWLDDLGDELSR
jgi:bifunctional DNase/RNase